MRYVMVNHANAHDRKRKGLPFRVHIYDTKNKENLATAYSIDFAAKIVSALNECAEKEGGETMPGSYHPITCCDDVCAGANRCRIGGYQCAKCRLWFCVSELNEQDLCDDCAGKEEV